MDKRDSLRRNKAGMLKTLWAQAMVGCRGLEPRTN